VEVVIAFVERGVGGCYYGEEESRGRELGGDIGDGEEAVS
jgi:hypothetical protein